MHGCSVQNNYLQSTDLALVADNQMFLKLFFRAINCILCLPHAMLLCHQSFSRSHSDIYSIPAE